MISEVLLESGVNSCRAIVHPIFSGVNFAQKFSKAKLYDQLTRQLIQRSVATNATYVH